MRVPTLFLLLLFIPLISLGASPFTTPVSTIILDAGHGGSDPGAFAETKGICEKEIVLEITKRVESILKQQTNFTTLLTRSDDSFVALAERALIASSTNPQVNHSSLLVSIHANSSPNTEAQGFEILIKEKSKRVTFFDSETQIWQMLRNSPYTSTELNLSLNTQNLLLAQTLQSAIAASFPSAKNRGVKEQDVWVLNGSKIPSALVEIGFLSNSEELSLMIDLKWQERMAEAIAQGIINYAKLY